jgi:hypothetical protein
VKKIVLFSIIGMLTIGASFLTIQAQNQPTGAPDTSVTIKPKPGQPVTTPAETKNKQEVIKEPAITNTTMILGIISTLVIAGLAVVLIRRNKSKKQVK